jgi:hypothetical protein
MPIHVFLAWFPWLLLSGGVLFLGSALLLGFRTVRALERRGAKDAEIAALEERVQLLEDAVAAHAEEMRLLADGVQFTERLLTQRGPPKQAPADSRPQA